MVNNKKQKVLSSKKIKKGDTSTGIIKPVKKEISFKKHKGRRNNSKNKKFKEIQQECERLEKLVLGDGSGLLDNVDAVEKLLDSQLQSSPDSGFDPNDGLDTDPTERKPAWEDPDDDQIVVLEALKAQGRLRKGLPGHSGEEYNTVLKRKFDMRIGNPEWAKLKRKRNDESDDDDEDDALLKRCGNFIAKKTSVLHKEVLDFRKLTNLNKNTQNEGPYINAVQFHPTSTVGLVAGSSSRSTIFQVDGTSNPTLQTVKFEKFPIRCARFSHDGNSFLVGSNRHSHFYMYDMIEGRTVRIPTHHASEQTNMKKFELSSDGRLIAVMGKFGHIHLLNARTKEWIDSLQMNGEVKDICFSSDSSRLFSHGDSGEVYIWDTFNRSCIHRFADDGCFQGTSIAVSPNNQLVACGSSSGVVNIYQTSTATQSKLPQPIKTVLNLVTPISLLDFNATSELLAMSSYEKENAAKLVHFPSMTVFKNFPGHKMNQLGQVQSQSFSPSSGYLAYGNSSNSSVLFRLKHFGNY